MQLNEGQYKHAISLLTPGNKMLLDCLEEALAKRKSSIDAFSLLMEISEKFGGLAYLSANRSLQVYLRNLTLVSEYQSGMSIRQLSKKYNLTHNTVYRVIRKANVLKG
ncbi:Mor transcription activator family protein [Vibrio parahaemolyticus]|uniref:Mor transcription activator family protein n=1 Tax=Vibrio harveyi group TaxID=717610 RepID=UPI0009962736|nr:MULTISPECIES: Mor transcription activator family protein [Vibrio harveyi group]QLK45488.1 transcriptional regulator [Vibrio owensii]HDM8216585.1 helix-turn-helix domain-containing protein [Vibrio campbellii]EJG1819091.1 helix-turn-helix domain-containing protein [Vibrio parahaemolyticus]MBE3895341.1 helix-turn-helix domain-containing protein [Vibrio parahaemolyticus]NOJ19059.1 helix-turn-helix domain-containing protein [Vibrio jasicida]